MDEKEFKRLLEMAADKDVQGHVDLWPVIANQLGQSQAGLKRSWPQVFLRPLRRATDLALTALVLFVAITMFVVWTTALRSSSLVTQGTPSNVDEGPVRGTLGEPVQMGLVSVMVTDVVQSELETVVGFQIKAQSGRGVEQLELPRLHLDRQAVEGNLQAGTPSSETVIMAYPPSAASTSVVTFTVGPLMVATGEPLTLTLDVEAIRSGGQEIRVGEDRLWFHGIEPTGEGGFRLLGNPVDESDGDFRLIGPGVRDVTMYDEHGRAYIYGGFALQYNRDRIRAFEIRSKEPLADDSSQLTIHIPAGARRMEATTLQLALVEEEEQATNTVPTPPPFCNPEDVPPGGPAALVLDAPENQRYWGSIRVTMMDTDVFPERVAHGTSLPDIQKELFERAIAVLRHTEQDIERLPYPSLGHYTFSTDEPCRKPDPSVQGYIVIEVWDEQVNLGYGGDGNLHVERVISALERELEDLR